MILWRYVRTSGSYFLILFLILYVAYFTSEVCLRIQNINKYERLQNYESEISELTNKLANFRKDSRNVKKSLGILKDVLKGIMELNSKSNLEVSVESISNKKRFSNKFPRKNVKKMVSEQKAFKMKSKDDGIR